MSHRYAAVGVLLIILLTGCAPVPPTHPLNICKIYSQYPHWYWASQSTYKKWGVPYSVQMAIIYQESRYNANAKPSREKLLWLIPWKRPTTALGYAQATDGTWQNYQRSTHQYNADRSNFAHANDFIGWYSYRAEKKLGISANNAYDLYLAFHDGINGYSQRSYEQKKWLKQVARKVERIANMYQAQLNRCQKSLPKKHWWN